MELSFEEKDFLACCGSNRFAKEMALASPFSSMQVALSAARNIWFNKVDVNGWLEAFSAHPQIGETPSSKKGSETSAQWSKGEQSTAFATATGSSLEELSEWNTCYREKFGIVFLICASGRSTDEILAELKRRYTNRPIVEFEIAALEQMKITELRLGKLFSTKENAPSTTDKHPAIVTKKAEGGHITAGSEVSAGKSYSNPTRTRPPITTHVLDVARGSPAAGIEVRLEMWKDALSRPAFGNTDIGHWVVQGSSTTDKDGRSGQLMSIVDAANPGIYRISFDTGKYCPSGFFPYVSIVFEIRESQRIWC
ncbi:Uric acid degradation bifunctional protein TTL [Quillaja saponaria]|uniref:2-oxo-4-hydroxy-4-carboxy-5-ureidoimidazoline decarboxylase n=1 Tax=Quillaja saponaria TaxID=32244 RepID=A0AAD7L302_QUISA|nr:Uric acid degradation bifunctional protein TTL [Quillaja saponaria]